MLDAAKAKLAELFPDEAQYTIALKLFKDIEKDIVRGAILRDGRRIDGRDTRSVRPISCDVGLLPRAHGSALFTRGETQALVVATFGTGQDEQMIDALRGRIPRILHAPLQFPSLLRPVKRAAMGTPGRRRDRPRQAGLARDQSAAPPPRQRSPTRCALSRKSPNPAVRRRWRPVCGAALAMMDAGVPLAAVRRRDRDGADQGSQSASPFSPTSSATSTTSATWTSRSPARKTGCHLAPDGHQDRLDHRGDHAKSPSDQARDGRNHILGEMAQVFDRRPTRSHRQCAAHHQLQHVPKDKIREIIGSGGKVIRETAPRRTGAKIDIEDDGTVQASPRLDVADKTQRRDPPDSGHRRRARQPASSAPARSSRAIDFGAFVGLPQRSRDGLVHISSELALRPRVSKCRRRRQARR